MQISIIVGTLEQRVRAVDLLLADGKIDQLEARLSRIKAETGEQQKKRPFPNRLLQQARNSRFLMNSIRSITEVT